MEDLGNVLCCKTMDGTTSSETQGVDKFPNTNLPKSVNPSVDVVILVFIVVFVDLQDNGYQ